jgi:hypothetical protein
VRVVDDGDFGGPWGCAVNGEDNAAARERGRRGGEGLFYVPLVYSALLVCSPTNFIALAHLPFMLNRSRIESGAWPRRSDRAVYYTGENIEFEVTAAEGAFPTNLGDKSFVAVVPAGDCTSFLIVFAFFLAAPLLPTQTCPRSTRGCVGGLVLSVYLCTATDFAICCICKSIITIDRRTINPAFSIFARQNYRQLCQSQSAPLRSVSIFFHFGRVASPRRRA